MDSVDGEVRPCVGCGYCCRKAPCGVALRVYGPVSVCPGLKWSDGRYVCDLMTKPGPVGSRYRAELYAGAGCCSPLNGDRNNIKPPATAVPAVAVNPIHREAQILLRNLSRQMMSGDQLWLTINEAQSELGPEWCRAALRLVQEERSSFNKEFMG